MMHFKNKKIAGSGIGGQTTIETVMMLGLLFLILFFIVEASRAWYLKNSLNNAARFGVRTASVERNVGEGSEVCPYSGSLKWADAACGAPGVHDGALAELFIVGDDPTNASQGDTLRVKMSTGFSTFIYIPGLENLTEISSGASMRHE